MLCLLNSLSTNTSNTSMGAPTLPLSLSQWGVGWTCVDSGVALVSQMIHSQCCANLRVSTHQLYTRLASHPEAYCATIWHWKLSLALQTHEENSNVLSCMHTHSLCNIWVSLGHYNSTHDLNITLSAASQTVNLLALESIYGSQWVENRNTLFVKVRHIFMALCWIKLKKTRPMGASQQTREHFSFSLQAGAAWPSAGTWRELLSRVSLTEQQTCVVHFCHVWYSSPVVSMQVRAVPRVCTCNLKSWGHLQHLGLLVLFVFHTNVPPSVVSGVFLPPLPLCISSLKKNKGGNQSWYRWWEDVRGSTRVKPESERRPFR